MPAAALIIDLVQEELEAYRRDGRPVHLAHAARALKEALAATAVATQEQDDVATSQKGR